ncbi:metal-dependent hydrolase [Halosolutus halophilus]|uniref:metal-dependent hydrolase n=1 Tax=Halosolutus halophilus TaxID=1552990 RepID=UPI00223503F3|nr:metal-dependent hydrolase [Halosolutus halophilus]
MLPLGHLAVAYLCYSLATRLRALSPPTAVPVLLVLGGSLFPDLVDKPLAWSLGLLPSGRSLGHSLLFLVPLAIGLSLLARRYGRGEYGIAFAIGAITHSLLDITPLLWDPTASVPFLFWPLIAVPIPPVLAAAHPPLGLFYRLSEVGFASLAVVRWRWDGSPGLEPLRAAIERDRKAPE